MLDTFMERFTKEMEVEGDFSTGVPGVYSIPIDEGVDVMVSEIPGGISFRCRMIACPESEREEFFTQAMNGNLLGNGTDGAVIGRDDEGHTVTLGRDIDYVVDYKTFSYMLEDFFNMVDYWREEAAAYGTS